MHIVWDITALANDPDCDALRILGAFGSKAFCSDNISLTPHEPGNHTLFLTISDDEHSVTAHWEIEVEKGPGPVPPPKPPDDGTSLTSSVAVLLAMVIIAVVLLLVFLRTFGSSGDKE